MFLTFRTHIYNIRKKPFCRSYNRKKKQKQKTIPAKFLYLSAFTMLIKTYLSNTRDTMSLLGTLMTDRVMWYKAPPTSCHMVSIITDVNQIAVQWGKPTQNLIHCEVGCWDINVSIFHTGSIFCNLQVNMICWILSDINKWLVKK